jgi:hypothetical protein
MGAGRPPPHSLVLFLLLCSSSFVFCSSLLCMLAVATLAACRVLFAVLHD